MAKKDTYLALLRRGIDEKTAQILSDGGIKVGDLKTLDVETLTNNKNRTASEIRSTFSKYGGNLGETGSVSYNFKKLGVIALKKKNSHYLESMHKINIVRSPYIVMLIDIITEYIRC